jgi:integrase
LFADPFLRRLSSVSKRDMRLFRLGLSHLIDKLPLETAMARPKNHTPPLRWHHKQTKQFCIYLNRDRVLLGTERDAAERKRLRLIAAHLNQPVTPRKPTCPDDLTVAEALERYTAFAEKHYKDDRAHIRIKRAVGAATSVHGDTLIARFDGAALREVRDSLLDSDPPLSRRYINHLITALKTAVAWMVERKICSAMVLAEIRTVKRLEFGRGGVELPEIPPVDPDVVNRTLPFCPPPVRAMIEIQRLTGMRPGELVIMRRRDVSTSPSHHLQVPNWSRTVHAIEVSGETIWMYVPIAHKNLWRGKTRIIAIPPAAREILAPILLAREPDEFPFARSMHSTASRERR